MNLPSWITDASAWLKIDRSDAAQLIVVTVGTIISTIAALVAWMAAAATSRSVREMREMRLQQSRPAFHLLEPQKFFFFWNTDGEDLKFSTENDGGGEYPSIKLKNFGAGPAVDVIFRSRETPDHFGTYEDISGLRRLFRAGGYKVIRANNGVEFVKNSSGESVHRWYSSQTEFSIQLGPFSVGEEKSIKLPKRVLEAFLLKSLSKHKVEDTHYAWEVGCELKFKSLSGEIIYEKYQINLFLNGCMFRLAAPVGELDGVPNWGSVEFSLSAYIHTIIPEPSLLKILAVRISKAFDKKISWVSKKLKPYMKPIRTWIIYGSKAPPEFRIGDRVLWVPAAEWAPLDDGEIDGPEPVIKDIDQKRWTHSKEHKGVGETVEDRGENLRK